MKQEQIVHQTASNQWKKVDTILPYWSRTAPRPTEQKIYLSEKIYITIALITKLSSVICSTLIVDAKKLSKIIIVILDRNSEHVAHGKQAFIKAQICHSFWSRQMP